MKIKKNNFQAGFAPIIVLVIVAIIALVAIKPIQKSIEQKIVVATPSPVISQQTNQSGDAEQQKKLEKYLTVEVALLGVSNNISLYFKDLDHGKQFAIEPTKSWIPASTIKTYVVLEAFRQKNLGLINFDHKIVVNGLNVVSTELETDEFPRLREGTTTTIRQLVEAMIIQSDNTAYNTLLDILDRRNINLALKNIGLTETVVGEKLNLDDTQFQNDLKVLGRQPNTTTVEDLATFFDLLYNKKIASSEEILNIFKRQKINNMIPALLPPSTGIAHKTGNWTPIYHDGGVVFKPGDPFILTIFTNTGDPNVIAKLARVAYFQTADSVGQPVSFNNQPGTDRLAKSPYDKIALNEEFSSILGQTSDNGKFPAVTAADLGINQKDLSVSPQEAQDLRSAFITPGALLYNLKTFIRDKQLQLTIEETERAKIYIDISKDKLAEVKTLLERGDVEGTESPLDQSEENLAKATQLSKNSPDKDLLLVQIKQVNDLHFAVLNEESQKLPSQDKEKFIDIVYNFYQKNNQEVTSVVRTSVIANVTQQKPAIGTITEVKNNIATLQFDDGTKKDVILNNGAKVRAFQQNTYQSPSSITKGDKVAIVGITNKDSKIVPEFILKDIPKELPNKHTGTVIEINPDQNTLRILDKKGQEEIIRIFSNTVLQSKDTNVSLDGIKAGSEVTVFGAVNNTKAQTNNSPLPSRSLTTIPKIPQGSSLPAQNSSTTAKSTEEAPAGTAANATTHTSTTDKQSAIEVKATSVTVITNSSGKNEVTTNKKPEQSNTKSTQNSSPNSQPQNKKSSEDKSLK